jgi:hypothetical protein
MKNQILKYSSLLIIILCSCKKDKTSDTNSLIGKWINIFNYNNSIEFIDNKSVKIDNQSFDYRINSDTIYFRYNGDLYIYCKETSHKLIIDFSSSTIKIKDLNNLCLVKGDTGYTIFSRTIIPNKFIGYWVSTDFLDTMIFITNSSFERPHIYYYDFYSYSYTNDSIKIQYAGPDKIFCFPLTYKYFIVKDTLIIDYSLNYHPNIKKGIKKYLKR